jgi:hypothetical protein
MRAKAVHISGQLPLTTLGSVLKRAGRLVLFLNNPYSLVVRGHITDYFAASGQAVPY